MISWKIWIEKEWKNEKITKLYIKRRVEANSLLNFSFFISRRCVHITDIGVGYISTMGSLSALFLRWCILLRDFGLQHLCGMKSLQVLSVAGKINLKPAPYVTLHLKNELHRPPFLKDEQLLNKCYFQTLFSYINNWPMVL